MTSAGTTGAPILKILGFDSWTGGAHHYQRLLGAFRDRGMELTLVHLGSWGGDVGRPARETLGELRARDISSYARKGFRDVLRTDNPSAVVFLSTDTFAHRAFNRYCRAAGIPTLNLFHGLVSVQAVDGGSVYKVNLLSQLAFVGSRIGKALRNVWPTYALSLLRTGATLREWMRFGQDIVGLTLGRFPVKSAADARTTRCCVYVSADVPYAVGKYGFAPQDVTPVGNPDLARFGLTADLLGAHLGDAAQEHADVMYVDTGLVFAGRVFSSLGDFVDHLAATRDALGAQGKRLVFKPHPDHAKTDSLSRFAEAGIELCSNDEFVPRLRDCCACIAEPSTITLIPALMGLPVFLANYGKLQEQRFGDVLTSYPRARLLRDVRDFGALLAEERGQLDVVQARQWIGQNAGPLPADQMPGRVADVLLQMIRNKA